jgi:hypothetical protein
MEIVKRSNQYHISPIKKLVWLCIFTMFAVPLFGSEADYVPGEVLVQFKPKDNGALRNTQERTEILSSLGGGTIVRSYKLVRD